MQGNKPASAWNLAGRSFLICLVFLVLPLFIHSFLQYRKEIHLAQEEKKIVLKDQNAVLKAIGWQLTHQLVDTIAFSWDLLSISNPTSTLRDHFSIEWVETPHLDKDFSAFIRDEKLFVLRKITSRDSIALVYPLHSLIQIKDSPFPIEVSFSPPLPSTENYEEFNIASAEITFYLISKAIPFSSLHQVNWVFRVCSFLFIVGVVGGGFGVLLLRRLSKPLNVLCLTMERVSEGAIHSRYSSQLLGFEINTLGNYFNQTMDALILHQRQAEEERAKKEKLAEKLKVAREIQRNLLPKYGSANSGLEVDYAYLPALEVSGDFYDLFTSPSGKTLITIADISDKGISACLYSLGLRSSLRSLMDFDLSEMVRKANELFCIDSSDSGQFATLWIGVLDQNKLRFLSLGHPPALLKRKGELQFLSTSHSALGIEAFSNITPSEITLEKGDEILLYSDGATEAMDPSGDLFGVERLKQYFLKSMRNTTQGLLEEIQDFTQHHPPQDDLTLLSVRYHFVPDGTQL